MASYKAAAQRLPLDSDTLISLYISHVFGTISAIPNILHTFGTILHARNAPRSWAVVFPILMLFFKKVAHCDYGGSFFFVCQNFGRFRAIKFSVDPCGTPFLTRFFSPKSAEKFFGHVSDQYEEKRKKKFFCPL